MSKVPLPNKLTDKPENKSENKLSTQKAPSMLAQKLDPANLPLYGRHLIEASAGTGKTYNITRLYLRLLLEKKLTVQQILVMTFTKAATEELKGRIDKELRNALNNWQTLIVEDAFFCQLSKTVSSENAEVLLKIALLELDDAAVFTIHGFCNRVLLQQAFNSGASLEMVMENDTREYLMNAVRDWFRAINQNEPDYARLKSQGWHTPEKFYNTFGKLLHSQHAIQFMDIDCFKQQYLKDKNQFLKQLTEVEALILEKLVNNKKGADKVQREIEWQATKAWLSSSAIEDAPIEVKAFFDGKRVRDASLKAIFIQFKSLNPIEAKLDKVACYQIVYYGILKIRQQFALLKQKQSVMDFDDLILFLSQTLQGKVQNSFHVKTLEPAQDRSQRSTSEKSLTPYKSEQALQLIQAIRQSYPVALVDEFQDTDPEQYAIFSTLYPKADKRYALFMIGDPKQAIYGFRGGDIFTYLAARQEADYHWFMDTNWRSTQSMVLGYNRLFWGKPLSEQTPADIFGYGIHYEQINFSQYAQAAQQTLFDPDSDMKSLNYAFLAEIAEPTGTRGATKEDFSAGIATWCSNEIVRLLNDVRLSEAPLQEQDIAVLVRNGREAKLIQQTLLNAGLNSVYLSDRSHIFDSSEAKEVLYVLTGILELENEHLLVRALSTHLMGGNAVKLAQIKTDICQAEWESAVNLAIDLRLKWQKQGVMTFMLELIHMHYQPNPLTHERSLTNMIHLAEILQHGARQFKHPLQLVNWFKQQCETQNTEAEQRLESDANLIRIVTQHGSKGLEYPIVFVPFASDYKNPIRAGQQTTQHFKFYDSAVQKTIYQIGETDQAKQQMTKEGVAESIRLLYVAVTRATHRCYLGIAPYKDSYMSALGQCLNLTEDTQWQVKLQQIAETSLGASQLIQIPSSQVEDYYQASETIEPALKAAQFTYRSDDKWSIYSFSGLTKNAHSNVINQLDNQERKDDLIVPPSHNIDSQQSITEISSDVTEIRFSLKKGAAAGNLLHDILEQVDFTDPDWSSHSKAPIARFGLLETHDEIHLINWLEQVIHTKLPNFFALDKTFCLADLTWQQTLREAEFYFPLTKTNLKAVLACLTQHRFGKQASYTAEQMIHLPDHQTLTGMMHGFIDLIFEHQNRFYVADYKSTHLGTSLSDYTQTVMTQNNQTHFYDLQYLIYSVALHRYLKQRIENYQVEQHFGGIYYLYLRGMSSYNNDEQNTFFGVYSHKLSSELLLQLDQAFD